MRSTVIVLGGVGTSSGKLFSLNIEFEKVTYHGTAYCIKIISRRNTSPNIVEANLHTGKLS